MNYKVGDIVYLKIDGSLMVNGANCYFGTLDGMECTVKKFKFQEKAPKPKEIKCIVKSTGESYGYHLIQDLNLIVPQIYQTGQSYDFTVIKFDDNNGLYTLADQNGLAFPLKHKPDTPLLKELQQIKCKVVTINGKFLSLEIDNTEKQKEIDFYSLKEILGHSVVNEDEKNYLGLALAKLEAFSGIAEKIISKDGLWSLDLLDLLERTKHDWLNTENTKAKLILNAIHDGCLFLLEKSTYLNNFGDSERVKIQQKLMENISQCAVYIDVMELIENKGYIEEISDTIESLQKSGLLYRPERKLGLMMGIFNLKEKEIAPKIALLFDIILEHDQDRWMVEPFKSAFIETMAMYVKNSYQLHISNNIGSEQGIKNMLKAIGIMALLGADTSDMSFYMSIFYRYASLLVESPQQALDLLRNAYYFLIHDNVSIPFEWQELKDDNIKLLCGKLAHPIVTKESDEDYYFDNGKMELLLSNSSITIKPYFTKSTASKAFAEGIMKWKNPQVILNGSLSQKIIKDNNDISKHELMWNEISDTLIEVAKPKVNIVKTIPADGEAVTIRITGVKDGGTFFCKIEDPKYIGEGTVKLRNFIHYDITGITAETFTESDGRYFLLKAYVHYEKDHTLTFDTMPFVNEWIYNSIRKNDIYTAKVTKASIRPNSYLCITEFGFNAVVQFSEMYKVKLGEIVKICVENVYENGNVNAYYEGQATPQDIADFNLIDGFYNLVSNVCGDNIFEDETEINDDEVKTDDNALSRQYVMELISILERVAVCQEIPASTFDYLAFAGLICHLVGDKSQGSYFKKQRDIIKTLQLFSDGVRVDEEVFGSDYDMSGSLIGGSSELKAMIHRVKIVSLMDKQWNDKFLMEMSCNTESSEISELAKRVITYNLLRGFKNNEAAEKVKNDIQKSLGLKIKLPQPVMISDKADENRWTEFKTSLVYPADNNMQPDPEKQMHVILRVICAMLNAEGGRLYIGVNDYGCVTGLMGDMKYYSGKTTNFSDYIRRLLTNAIVKRIGDVAASRVTLSVEEHKGMMVLVVDVKQMVVDYAKVDGTEIYYRHDSTIHTVTAKRMREILANRG